jgi:cyclin T
MILTTLDFELEVTHPYAALSSALGKLGLSHTVLLNVAWNLINEG